MKILYIIDARYDYDPKLFQFRVYHYASEDNRVVYDYQSPFEFASEQEAVDAADEWCDAKDNI